MYRDSLTRAHCELAPPWDTGAFDTVWLYLLLYLESALAVKFNDARHSNQSD